MFHSQELEVIRFIQQFRAPALDTFFKFLDYFDRPEFLLVLIPALWLGKDWKMGLKIFYVLLLAAFANDAIKDVFGSPRPFHLDPSLGVIQVKGYGFPSGAAQTVILLSGFLLSIWKNSNRWLVSFSYILLISFSRIYLGVHFPSDILGGWIMGFILFGLFFYSFPLVENQLQQLKPIQLFWMSQISPLLLLIAFWEYFPVFVPLCACGMGMGAGLFVNDCFDISIPKPRNRLELLIRIGLGVIGTFSVYFASSIFLVSGVLMVSLRLFLVGFWISSASVYTCYKLFRKKTKLR